MPRFDPRAIPHRAHYDRLMTWAASVFGRLDHETIDDFQRDLHERGAKIAKTDDDDAKIRAVLTELGFCAVVDHMAGIIEDNAAEGGGSRE
jgi:hypothetical protein